MKAIFQDRDGPRTSWSSGRSSARRSATTTCSCACSPPPSTLRTGTSCGPAPSSSAHRDTGCAPKKPIRGTDAAGRVEAVGKDVTRLRPGDEVLGWCEGAFAEYVCADESHFVSKLAGLSFEAAATLPMAGCTALQGLRNVGAAQPGQRVLVIGAGGGVGTYAVQIAKELGCRRHRGLQHVEARPRPLARRRRGHRLHAGGLHARRPALRRDLPAGGDRLALGLQARTHPEGHARAQ